ncbi:hypothetical protein [Tenacibaculum phage JQ]|nr:hypothetical protein [Tenacibaculum phage JQ]
MNITDATYYQLGKKFIPSIGAIQAPVQGVPTNDDKLDYFIAKYERLLLLNSLGVTLYNELKQALLDIDNAATKWQNLVKGIEYVKDGVTYRFDGLRGFEKDSFVAYFVFCKYMENDESYYSTTGTTKAKAENTTYFEPTRKYIDAWNIFLNGYQKTVTNSHPNYYTLDGEIVGIDYYNEPKGGIVSLEQYLEDNKADFEGYSFKRYESINSLGI